ncbi:MAG: ABC transporter permease subunit [Pseudomonadales bacterium]|nr:ABC transporter permease subunit [Pseudomonadales bacterium]
MTDTSPESGIVGRRPSLLPDAQARKKLRLVRSRKDKLYRWGITTAGFGVVFALALIFVYLFYEVAPILRGASTEITASYQSTFPAATTENLLLERYEELGIEYTSSGIVNFFELDDGESRQQLQVGIPEGTEVTSFAAAESISAINAFGLSDGSAMVVRHGFELSFPNDERLLHPQLDFPFGETALQIDPQRQALRHLAIESAARGPETTHIAAETADGRLLLSVLSSRSNLLTGAVTLRQLTHTLPAVPAGVVTMLLDKSMRSLFVADRAGFVHYYDISNPAQARLLSSVNAGEGAAITAMQFLVGSVSLIVGTEAGELSQWFLVRDEQNEYTLTRIRDFRSHGAAITAIAPEYTRKGFVAGDQAGQIGIHYGTSSRTLFLDQFITEPVAQLAISPLNSKLMVKGGSGELSVASLWNEHPQLSFQALWNKVWYEGRADPEYIWQSSSATDEFESKFSLVPLSIGTLKAAFYAMLFAMPLAIAGAIYTAYFMTPRLRGVVKPSIEIMEALPTVILGFLAGLWLAPFVEQFLPAVFSFLLLMPVLMLGFAYIWGRLPGFIHARIPDGWEAVLLMPLILIFGFICVALSPWLEIWFFSGSMRQWFTDIGITYDQRNALIVGIAMGFAVIPTIFSIAEDAVFTVPRHLTQGSLALGATRWQTVMGVVLPTASPGIFSAIMMGFGRAVGETMIVLMATGNSPVVNFNIFEGMRTLSANIAVELPETAVGSSHFRVLFLAALVLLSLTFLVNTAAEIIRQRLRQRYSNL